MEENLQATKRFFKVMTRDFHTKLALPKDFCKDLLNVKKSATIRSGKGIWKVSVSKDSNNMVCFEEGWGDFVRQHDLAVGDVVVFKHIGEMHFNAFVFDFTACEKKFDESLAETNGGSGGSCNNLEASKTNAGGSYNPYFIITIKDHNSPASKGNRVHIPAEFWKSNGLNKKSSVNLRDPSGKKWLVELKFYESAGNNRVVMSRGWKQFYESNELKNGDVCTFRLNHNPESSIVASMDVHISPLPS
ncbi:unnamed protein product [Fraxinus pennsylvanica]|uniref:TF-B3 domain-containing protein n=1 Tax=Fraxinus pennsylvanica TaxID=56036 RepID=A0AAD1Z831_9LAMI|nr:unnamed protein product [Fraxinus pennsylvanica]